MIGYISTHTVLGLQHFLLQEGETLLVGLTNDDDSALVSLVDHSGWETLHPGLCHIAEAVVDYAECEFIFADGPLSAELYQDLVELGVPLVVPHPRIVEWENDRALGKTLAQQLGFTVAPASAAYANDGNELSDKLRQWPQQQLAVIKGDLNSVIMPAADAVDYLQQASLRDSLAAATSPLYLEQFVEGFEVAYGGWFNGQRWLPTFILTHEYKAACENGRGWTLTGEVGTYFEFVAEADLNPTIQVVLQMLQPLLAAVDYRGFVDLNTLCSGSYYTFLEFTIRPGFPTELEMAGWLKQNQLAYADLLRWCAGLKENCPVPTGYGLAGALFVQGLGLNQMISAFQPRLHGYKPQVKTELLPFDACWDAEANTWRVFDWDRFVFVAVYLPDGMIFPAIKKALRENLNRQLQGMQAWGHTHRTDLGANIDKRLVDYQALPVLSRNVAQIIKVSLNSLQPDELQILAHYDELYFPADLAWDLPAWQEGAAETDYTLVVDGITHQSELLQASGYAVWTFKDNVLWLENMLVLPQWRGTGVGTRLLKNPPAEYNPQIHQIKCEVHRGSLQYLPFYQQLGFKEIEQLKIGDELTTVVLQLDRH